MTVLIVVIMFAVFILIDHYLRKAKQPAAENSALVVERSTTQLPAPLVAGFNVPDNLRYHPGHAWALSESPTLVRIGMDDFASKLAGKIERITLPQRGQWIRQGQKVWTLFRDGRSVDMYSPIEGEVTNVNDAALHNPEAARKDPYGNGWLVMVHSPEATTNLRNLLSGALARAWTDHCAARLRSLRPVTVGALAQDGGIAVDDATSHLPDQEWAALAKEFFLS